MVEFDDACKEFEGGVAERDGVMEKELVEIKVSGVDVCGIIAGYGGEHISKLFWFIAG